MHFGEYELSPSLIGLSPLPTGHPKTFQRLPVRSSSARLSFQSGRGCQFYGTGTDGPAQFITSFTPLIHCPIALFCRQVSACYHRASGWRTTMHTIRQPLSQSRYAVFLINSRSHRFSAASLGSVCTTSPTKGTPSSEVTVSICRVPSPEFSQAP